MNSVVYVATQPKYVVDAEKSAKSLKKTNPHIKLCLISNCKTDNVVWDYNLVLPNPSFSIEDKLQMNLMDSDKCVYLDSDTYITNDISELFELLDKFDIAAYQESSGYHYKLPNVPNAFPEFNTGLIAFRNNDRTKLFFDSWRYWFDVYRNDMGREWDQRSFRKALYESTLRYACLPNEYNFMPYFTKYAMTDLKVIHGKPYESLLKLEKEMNKKLGGRAYVPGIGVVYPANNSTILDVFNLFCRSFVLLMKTLVKSLLKKSK